MEGMLDGTVAEVRADGITTRYARAGTGSPVLLLCCAVDPRFDALFAALAATRRVIAPLESAAADETRGIVARIVAFLDGAGLGPLPVVGVAEAAGPAAAFASAHPDRVERLVLLGEPNGDAAGEVAAVVAALGG